MSRAFSSNRGPLIGKLALRARLNQSRSTSSISLYAIVCVRIRSVVKFPSLTASSIFPLFFNILDSVDLGIPNFLAISVCKLVAIKFLNYLDFRCERKCVVLSFLGGFHCGSTISAIR